MDAFGDYSNLFLFLFTLALVPLFAFTLKSKKQLNLPPGPPAWPIVGNLFQLKNSSDGTLSSYVAQLRQKYGHIFTMRMGSRSLIMIASHELAHEALVEKGSALASRPPVQGIRRIFSSNGHSINSAPYGPLWRTLRRNLANETLSPRSISSSLFAEARQWGLEVLLKELRDEAAQNGGIVRAVSEHLRFAVSCILQNMCFGIRTDDRVARDVQRLMREVILSVGGVAVVDAFPVVVEIFLRKRWNMMRRLRQRQLDGLLPLIRKRREELANGAVFGAYVDSLFLLTVDDGRRLRDDEVVTLCTEFLNAGTDTTATCLEWVLANLVLRQDVQAKLHDEIVRIVGNERGVREEDVRKMDYLNAVVKETLRRHPPGGMLLFHGATKACTVDGYDIPMDVSVNFDVVGIGRDSRVWEMPLEFVPERFLVANMDMETKMIPFGVGRRICPGMGLAMLHLNLIVARVVQAFQWECVEGGRVDLAEKEEFTTVMKHPLQAVVKERFHGTSNLTNQPI